jgi:hypothetical protein
VLNDGLHYLFVQAKDLAGNWSSSNPLERIVDTVPYDPPVVYEIGETDLFFPIVRIKSSDGYLFRYRLDEGSWEESYDRTHQFSTALSIGSHTIDIQNKDSAGNLATTTLTLFRNPYMGGYFEGGIIFYLDGNGNGLICAESDQFIGGSDTIKWGSNLDILLGTGDNLFDSEMNTDLILNSESIPESAALICSELVIDGYDDWYLPSYHELDRMYYYREEIGGFDGSVYYCSSEKSSSIIWTLDFRYYSWSSQGKSNYAPNYVRAIRSFSY